MKIDGFRKKETNPPILTLLTCISNWATTSEVVYTIKTLSTILTRWGEARSAIVSIVFTWNNTLIDVHTTIFTSPTRFTLTCKVVDTINTSTIVFTWIWHTFVNICRAISTSKSRITGAVIVIWTIFALSVVAYSWQAFVNVFLAIFPPISGRTRALHERVIRN